MPNNQAITFQIAPEAYQPLWEKKIKQYTQNHPIKGFRKSSPAATTFAKTRYGSRFRQEAVFEISHQKLEEHIAQNALIVFKKPVVLAPESKINWHKELTFSITYELQAGKLAPFDINKKITLPRYTLAAVDEAYVEKHLEELRSYHCTYMDRDKARIGYAIYGKATSREKQESPIYFTLSDEIAQQLAIVGKKKQDTIEMTPALITAFPQPFALFAKEQEKHTGFHLTIQRILEKKLPPVDQAFFEKVFPNRHITTEKAFYEAIKKEALLKAQRKAVALLHQQIKDLLLQKARTLLPNEYVAKHLEHLVWQSLITKYRKVYDLAIDEKKLIQQVTHYYSLKIADQGTPIDQETLQKYVVSDLQHPQGIHAEFTFHMLEQAFFEQVKQKISLHEKAIDIHTLQQLIKNPTA